MAEGDDQTSTISSSINNDVNEQYLASLIEMGIDQEAARQALKLVNNRSLEDALAVIFDESTSSINNTKEQRTAGNQTDMTANSIFQNSNIEVNTPMNTNQNDDIDESIMTYKMLFVVNGSLQMSSGKIAAQVAHCAIDLYQKLIEKNSKSLNYWYEYGETKIVVRGKSTEELLDIESRAKINSSIITSIIEDAGRTEIKSGSITCLGLFGTNKQLNPITGHLRLMQDCLKCSGN
ncbi:unnamed protein product [Rotaria sordida]|uniref:peptidyl-tRNA hydrolase n=1 Tax=Rotaria sordida TaxID=392033 RepID=A0A815TK96_9BILA|nr:unnamed protein product [Rotaria sordida]CAF1302747.1 unnamed protein product [Rotaria sordida]CAF1506662.1 unnamed protein product [Rotaria sordida]CAF1506792.1 unnamed protein product [Rotaria sordida]CAF3873246.1 unnamed protein product [Rotaria sordida]